MINDLWLGQWEPLNRSHHCAKFDPHKSCGRGQYDQYDNMTEFDHMIKEACDTVGWGALTWVNILPSLVVVDSVEVDI